MSLQRLLACSTQSQEDPGVVISTRLKELLQVNNPEPVETTSTQSPDEDDHNPPIRTSSEHNHSYEHSEVEEGD